MIDPKVPKQATPSIVVDPKGAIGKLTMVPDGVPSQDRIRERAYELYEGRGCEPGRAEQDWLRAEREMSS